MNHFFIALFIPLITLQLHGQIDPAKIDIVRDAYGVPHIFSETDAELRPFRWDTWREMHC
jgi:acyl-homoserine lactone acylase PvdQ